MPGTIGIINGLIFHDSGATALGMIVGQSGVSVTQATLQSISYSVTRTESDGITLTVTNSGTLAIASVIFDAPVMTDPRSNNPYNFLATIPADAFVMIGRLHYVDVKFVPVVGERFHQAWQGVTL